MSENITIDNSGNSPAAVEAVVEDGGLNIGCTSLHAVRFWFST